MAVTANGTHLIFNDNSTQSTAAVSGSVGGSQIFTTPGTFNIPPTTTKMKVTVVGGGGTGGTSGPVTNESTVSIGGGGGGGGVGVKVISAPFPVTSVPVTVGGVAGTTSFGTYASATGGANGSNGTSNSNAVAPGGAGGSSPASDLNFVGQAGGASFSGFFAPGGTMIFPGSASRFGGDSPYSNRTNQPDGPSLNNAGVAGIGFGAGGNGGKTGSFPAGGFAGGTGTPGFVIVEFN